MKSLIQTITNTTHIHSRLDLSLLIYRVLISAALLNTHGLKKLLHFEETIEHIPDPIGIGGEASAAFAVFANVICPVLISLGFFTRLFTLPILSITLMGFFMVHANDPWPVRDVPLMYSIAFALLFVLGPGKISIDQKLNKLTKS